MRHLSSFTTSLLLLLATLSSTCALAQEADSEQPERIKYDLILPEEKMPESVKPNETNPFSKVSRQNDDDSSSEENQVKELLLSMPVGGISTSAEGGKRVMLGGFKLERGTIVPQVIPGQTVKLRVNSVSDTTVEMVWVEKKNTGLPPRLLIIPFSVRPSIRIQLPSMAANPVPAAAAASRGGFGIVSNDAPPEPPPPANTSTTGAPQSAAATAPVPPPPPAPGDANHPANMLMNLLLSKPQPTQKP